MFIHRHPRHRLTRLLPAGLRVMALFGVLFAAAALLESPQGATPAPARQLALAHPAAPQPGSADGQAAASGLAR